MTPLEKRIKRHVTARQHEFYAVLTPGFEPVCQRELTRLLEPRSTLTLDQGGIHFQGRLAAMLQTSLELRTANRILMRLLRFKATAFDKLTRRVAAFPWELFLKPGTPLDVHVTARHSRLHHTGAIAQRLVEEVSQRLPVSSPGGLPPMQQRLFVRVLEDHFTISLDASGDPLYKRGLKTHRGAAPLRETTAAAILHLAGYRPGMLLMDPMCGSGTFSLEAALMAKRIPAGWFRSFAFMDWPAFRPRQWGYLRKQIAPSLKREATPVILASDRQQAACGRLAACLRQFHLDDVVTVRQDDFFNLLPPHLGSRAGLVVINPPYGVRLQTVPRGTDWLPAILDRLQQAYPGWRAAVIFPSSQTDALPPSAKRLAFRHGGLFLTLAIFDIPGG
jgi:putative N6-adenine-specific DNA methylase